MGPRGTYCTTGTTNWEEPSFLICENKYKHKARFTIFLQFSASFLKQLGYPPGIDMIHKMIHKICQLDNPRCKWFWSRGPRGSGTSTNCSLLSRHRRQQKKTCIKLFNALQL